MGIILFAICSDAKGGKNIDGGYIALQHALSRARESSLFFPCILQQIAVMLHRKNRGIGSVLC
jgi:hypothetical protein